MISQLILCTFPPGSLALVSPCNQDSIVRTWTKQQGELITTRRLITLPSMSTVKMSMAQTIKKFADMLDVWNPDSDTDWNEFFQVRTRALDSPPRGFAHGNPVSTPRACISWPEGQLEP
jgi:hypothetical protein